jgi:hypothetical protein
MKCHRCGVETNYIYATGQELICYKCNNGPKQCSECRRNFNKSERGASVFTKEKKGWFCWDCISPNKGYTKFGSGIWDDAERTWQICTVTFEEVTDDSDLKFVRTFEEIDDSVEGKIIQAIRNFFKKCSETKWHEAYMSSATDLQMDGTPSGIQHRLRSMGFTSYDSSEWPKCAVYKTHAVAKGVVRTKSGNKIPMSISLVVEDDWPEGLTWKVAAID